MYGVMDTFPQPDNVIVPVLHVKHWGNNNSTQ